MNDNQLNNKQTEKSEKMTTAEFEEYLPEFFAAGRSISEDPRFNAFLIDNPDSAALVRDLQYIATAAQRFLEPEYDVEPSADVWSKIQQGLNTTDAGDEPVPSTTNAR